VKTAVLVLPARVWNGPTLRTGPGTLLGPEGTGRLGGNLRVDPKTPRVRGSSRPYLENCIVNASI
jgi:hypothetical protein